MKPQEILDGKKTDPSDRIAFREGGAVADPLWENLFSNGKIQVCVEQSNYWWHENPGDFQLFSIYWGQSVEKYKF